MVDVEIEEAKALIASFGGNPQAFEFEVRDDWVGYVRLFPPTHVITVMFDGHKPQYRVNGPIHWLTQLREDIVNGAFGPNFKKWR